VKSLFDKGLFVPHYATINRVEAPRTSAEEYVKLLTEQLCRFKDGSGRRCERLVIWVDDLDRLSAEEMVAGLDAIRTFLELSGTRMPPGLGVVFVISCDEEKVATALADRRRDGDLPGAILTRGDARKFLDRLFQFRLEIPPFPKQDLRAYALGRLTAELPALADDLRRRGMSLEEVVDRMIHVGVGTPRSALQILNAFAGSWWLAVQRERDGAGTAQPVGCRKGR
jgi:hypothetical protein